MFKTPIKQLNTHKPYVFTDRGLVQGMIAKTELKTGRVKYYTSNYRVFESYAMAVTMQKKLNGTLK